MITASQTTFLGAYAECGHVREAARAANIHPSTHYRWLANGDEYCEQFRIAQIEAADGLESEARRRAVEGVRRYKFNRNGEPILHPVTGGPYYELVYSDALLITLLKANLPAKYGDRVESKHTGSAETKILVYLPENGRDSPQPA